MNNNVLEIDPFYIGFIYNTIIDIIPCAIKEIPIIRPNNIITILVESETMLELFPLVAS